MINIAICLGIMAVLVALLTFLKVHILLSLPLGLIVGLVVFILLGRKVQEALQGIMAQMQKELQANRIDRAIDILKQGFAFEKRHIFVGSQINSQIGILYYLKKDYKTATEYLTKGFVKQFQGQCMLAIIQFKNKNYDQMKEIMEATIQSNKKESICYALYAYLLVQALKDKDKAIETLQKGLKKLPDDDRLSANLTNLQNNRKMKMKVYGEIWTQFMLERPPRVVQDAPAHMRMSKKAMFR